MPRGVGPEEGLESPKNGVSEAETETMEKDREVDVYANLDTGASTNPTKETAKVVEPEKPK